MLCIFNCKSLKCMQPNIKPVQILNPSISRCFTSYPFQKYFYFMTSKILSNFDPISEDCEFSTECSENDSKNPEFSKGQQISKQNCRVLTSLKKRTKCTQDTILKLRLDNFVSRSTDLQKYFFIMTQICSECLMHKAFGIRKPEYCLQFQKILNNSSRKF